MNAFTHGTSSPLLEVENLNVSFGRMSILHDISFSIGQGEIVGLVGESGSGKSMTCRTLIGLLPATAQTSGRLTFGDRNLMALSQNDLRMVRGREISMIFQNPASHLDPLMSLGGHVEEPLRYHFDAARNDARRQAIALLDDVQIIDPAQRIGAYPHELSGGMKQRGLIAAAMACRPKLLLADEPTTALDVTVQARILELLKSLNRDKGVSIVFVSHDLAVVAKICDRVIVMREGRIVEEGQAGTIIQAPKHPYTRLLINSQPALLQLGQSSATVDLGATPLIEIDNLSVTYSKPGLLPGSRRSMVCALDGAAFSIDSGEAFGIVGESGSGKSTIARTIMHLIEPSGGEVRYRGKAITKLSGDTLLAFRRKVQMVFQNPFDSLNPRMRVLQMIAEPMIRHGILKRSEALQRARDLMQQVELSEELADRRPRQLSGGQCQRVGIARALALDPEVLIADEITSALDVTIQAQILKLLMRLRRERGLTIIYISHDLAVVRAFCDRVAVFHAGELVECGRTKDVLDNPSHDYTRLLITSAPRLTETDDDIRSS